MTDIRVQMPLQGIDLSYCQDPNAIGWARAAETLDFVIARSTYGTSLDTQVTRHAERVRAHALTLGLYHFWHAAHESDRQLRAFSSIAKVVRLGDGDICPVVDIEDHGLRKNQPPKYAVCPEWAPRLHTFVTHLIVEYGRAVVYCSQRDWTRLGAPDWLLQLPLWIAHWTTGPAPLTPGDQLPAIWQHKVAPLEGVSRAPIDQDIACKPLPVIGDDAWLDEHADQQIASALDTSYRKLPRP